MSTAATRGVPRLWGAAAIALAVAVLATALPWYLATASASAPVPTIYFVTSHHADGHRRSGPIAGRAFTGLTIISEGTVPARFASVQCNAKAGKTFLRARKSYFFTPGPPYVETVVCTWNIPADAAGRRLVLLGHAGEHRARVVVKPKGGQNSDAVGPAYSWRVKKA
jgi:hypothetical protein